MVTTRSGRTTDGVHAQKRKRAVTKKVSLTNKRTGKTTKVVTAAGVKSVLMGLAETKRFVGIDTTYNTMNLSNFTGYNLMYWIPNGTNDVQKIGDDVHLMKFRLRSTFRTSRPTFTVTKEAGDDIHVAVYIIKSNYQNHDGLVAPSAAGFAFPDFRHATLGTTVNPGIDFNQVQIVWQKKFVWKSNTAGTIAAVSQPDNQYFVLNEDVFINKPFRYTADASGYERDKNYYLVVGHSNPFNDANLIVQHALAYEVDFKDM